MLELSNLARGKYELKVHQVGYRVNDVYTDFLDMGSSAAPTQEQVARLDRQNDGSPIEIETIKIGRDGKFSKEIKLRENDVFLVTLTKM